MPPKTKAEKIATVERRTTVPPEPSPSTFNLQPSTIFFSLHDLRQTAILTTFLTALLFLLWVLQLRNFI